jgi:hypothetical protein
MRNYFLQLQFPTLIFPLCMQALFAKRMRIRVKRHHGYCTVAQLRPVLHLITLISSTTPLTPTTPELGAFAHNADDYWSVQAMALAGFVPSGESVSYYLDITAAAHPIHCHLAVLDQLHPLQRLPPPPRQISQPQVMGSAAVIPRLVPHERQQPPHAQGGP